MTRSPAAAGRPHQDRVEQRSAGTRCRQMIAGDPQQGEGGGRAVLPTLQQRRRKNRVAVAGDGHRTLRQGSGAPDATRELWRQCIFILDALNAATFDLLCNRAGGAFVARSLAGMFTRSGEWHAFVENLKKPQWLMPKSVY